MQNGLTVGKRVLESQKIFKVFIHKREQLPLRGDVARHKFFSCVLFMPVNQCSHWSSFQSKHN